MSYAQPTVGGPNQAISQLPVRGGHARACPLSGAMAGGRHQLQRLMYRWHTCQWWINPGTPCILAASCGSGSPIHAQRRLAGMARALRALDSVADVACQICHSRGREASLLLCDGCRRGYHRRCLTPALTAVPDGQWFCPSCVSSDPSPQQHIPRRQRRVGPWPSG